MPANESNPAAQDNFFAGAKSFKIVGAKLEFKRLGDEIQLVKVIPPSTIHPNRAGCRVSTTWPPGPSSAECVTDACSGTCIKVRTETDGGYSIYCRCAG